MCCPGPKLSPDDMSPTILMRPVRSPPRGPMLQRALPRQLMPRAVMEDTLQRRERKVLGRIVEGLKGWNGR